MRLMSVVLPLPVLPTMAVVTPGSTTREMPRSTGSWAPGYRNSTSLKARVPVPAGNATGVSGSPIDGEVRRHSWARPEETRAPRDHDEHEHGHHHREQDLHRVLKE